MFQFLRLAPLADSYDFWIAIAVFVIPQIIFWVNAYKASTSGSYVKGRNPNSNVPVWNSSDENVSIFRTGWFFFAVLHFVFWNIFFWGFLWSDHHDVWFI